MTLMKEIRRCIERKLDEGFREFIIYPLGDVGIQVKQTLNHMYGIQESYIIDDHRCQYNPQIKPVTFLETIDCKKYCLLLACTNWDIYEELKSDAKKYFAESNIAELSSMKDGIGNKDINTVPPSLYHTQIGKYSYGPLCCDNIFIESIGAFCSFALGTAVVDNHEQQYITTHPIIYLSANEPVPREYVEFSGSPCYFEGIQPKREKLKWAKRIRIGNDVWLGRNVIITNYANIGNGVIAGAGAVITKDVPDYAVVAGVPARIIRYRYNPEQIDALNKIAWWDWSDDEIRERYDDLYLPVDEFIQKYK